MRRVAVTGIGIVSSIGDNAEQVLASLREARSGIVSAPDYIEHGFRSQVHAPPKLDWESLVDRRAARFLSPGLAYAHVAMDQAIADSGLEPGEVSNERTGLIVGAGGPSTSTIVQAVATTEEKGSPKRIGPFAVPKAMSSGPSAVLSTWFEIKGINYSISSACATSAHCIGTAWQQIRWGEQDVMFAGGGEECSWAMAMLFDAMGALSSKRNDVPGQASRPYDADRDGFVIAGGGGALVLESLSHAQARGASILAELVGFGATSDGVDMVAPSGEGAAECMRKALAGHEGKVDYINTHGTSTPVGDMIELRAMRQVFGSDMPSLSSTKSLSGHSLGAAGVQEAIYCLAMMREGFVAGSANLERLDDEAADLPVIRASRAATLDTVLSNSFGFGGTNASLLLRRWQGE